MLSICCLLHVIQHNASVTDVLLQDCVEALSTLLVSLHDLWELDKDTCCHTTIIAIELDLCQDPYLCAGILGDV